MIALNVFDEVVPRTALFATLCVCVLHAADPWWLAVFSVRGDMRVEIVPRCRFLVAFRTDKAIEFLVSVIAMVLIQQLIVKHFLNS